MYGGTIDVEDYIDLVDDYVAPPRHTTNNNNTNNNANNYNHNRTVTPNYRTPTTTTTTTTTTITSTNYNTNNNSNTNNRNTNNNTNANNNTTNNNVNSNYNSNNYVDITDKSADTDIQLILGIFPDCDVDYLRNMVLSNPSPNRVEEITNAFLEKRDYVKSAGKSEKGKEREKGGLPADLNIEELGNKDYYNTTPVVSALYQDTCAKVLANRFLNLNMTFIRNIMKGFNNHFLPSLRALEREAGSRGKSKERKFLKSPRAEIPLPPQKDADFWKEYLYSQHEKIIQQEQEDSKLAHQLNEEEYSKTGQLIECNCCFGEYAFDDMAQCPDGHLACGDCFRKGAETVLGEGKTILRCYTSGCNFAFMPSELAKFLPKKTLEYFQKRQQEEEINQVDIPGLEKCPFCPYAVIIENQDDKVFHCLNCKKDTCRLCKEESHIPLRCNEVEKKQNRDMRLFIEQQMTDALCRTCNNPRCKKVFYKEEGCNHMKCTCGWEMCYICRKTIKGYGHFKEGGCILHEDTKKRNRDDVKQAEKEARASFLDEHPELAVELQKEQKEKGKENARKKRKQSKDLILIM